MTRLLALAIALALGGAAAASPSDMGTAPHGDSAPERQRVKKRVRDGEPPQGDGSQAKPKEPPESRKVDK